MGTLSKSSIFEAFDYSILNGLTQMFDVIRAVAPFIERDGKVVQQIFGGVDTPPS